MDANTVQRYRKQLHTLREDVRGRIQASMEAVPEEILPVGEGPTAPSEGLDKELAVERNEGSLFDAIDAALQRIDAGTFGTCVECGVAIPDARLKALPYAAYCIGCEQRLELQARRT